MAGLNLMLCPKSLNLSIATIQTFQKRYITFLYLQGVIKNFPKTSVGLMCRSDIFLSQCMLGIENSYFVHTCKYAFFTYSFSDICQLRLDFDFFDLTESTTAGTTAGACIDSFIMTGPTGRNPMNLCGTLTDMHGMCELESRLRNTATICVVQAF